MKKMVFLCVVMGAGLIVLSVGAHMATQVWSQWIVGPVFTLLAVALSVVVFREAGRGEKASQR